MSPPRSLLTISSWLRRRGPRLLLELVVVLVILLALEAFLTRNAARGPAPPFEAVTLAGESIALKDLAGQPAVIHFWATWCPVCELEQGMVNRLAEAYPVITVAMQSGSAEEVTAYMRDQGVNYPVINDPDGALSAHYGVRAVPASFILDAKGEVRFVTRGYTTGLGLRVRLWLAGVLAGASSSSSMR